MRKNFIIALGVMLVVLGVAVAVTPSQAATVPTSAVSTIIPSSAAPTPKSVDKVKVSLGLDGKFHKTVDGKAAPMTASAVTDYRFVDWKFGGQWICQLDSTGPNTPVATVGDAFESGTNPPGTVVLSYRDVSAGCPGYTEAQTLWYTEYQSADNSCGHLYVDTYTVADPLNPYYTKFIGPRRAQITINTYYSSCRGTAQRRANVASGLTGYALGLAYFNNYFDDSIMNQYFANTYSLAGPFDRNSLWLKY